MSHAEPVSEAECAVCFDEITAENYVEYRDGPDRPWKPSNLCEQCVEDCKGNGWAFFTERLTKATCAAELRRLMDKDKTAFPCENDSDEVYEFWFKSDGEVHSAKLLESLVGDARKAWWDEKLAFKFEEDEEEKKEEAPATE